MLPRLIEQVAVLATAMALLGVPGAALVSLLRIRSALPDTLAVPAGVLLGALVACVATFVQLVTRTPVEVAVTVHVALAALLVAAAVLVHRRRATAGEVTVLAVRGWDRWTTLTMVVGALFAWIVRGTIRLDGLYHVALSRKLIELSSPGFDNVNRFSDGGPNPTYALPGWHAMIGWTSWITHIDPVIAWEIMPVLVVALGALAAGGLARVVLGDPRAQPLGALGWVLMRVLYARREVDGDAILFGAVPGQVVFELVLPVVFASIAVAMWTQERLVRRAALTMATVGIALVVIFHANYIPYIAIVGVGYVAWWAVSGPFPAGQWRRTLTVGGIVAAACAGFLAIVLPLLAQLENFGNAPEDARIDYHLDTIMGMTDIRGGHLYETFGLPGLVALLAAPIVAARWRSREMSVAAGGLLAVGAVCIVPPLYALLNAAGSLTVGLRINHVVGVLLGPMLAGAVLLVADAVASRGWSQRRILIAAAAVTVVAMAAGVAIGYRKFLPDIPGLLAWAALAAVFAWRLWARIRSRHTVARIAREIPAAPGRLVVLVTAVLVVGLGFPVGAISARRAIYKADPFTAGTRSGELECLGGDVERALRQLPGGSVVLSDPNSSFRAMALAPVYVVGDYKIWNSSTGDSRTVDRLASVNRFFDSSVSDERRLEVLEQEDVDYLLVDLGDGRWLGADELTGTPTTERIERAWSGLDAFADFQGYDGGGIARLIGRHGERFDEVAVDHRAPEAGLVQPVVGVEPPPCNSYGLWRITGGDGG